MHYDTWLRESEDNLFEAIDICFAARSSQGFIARKSAGYVNVNLELALKKYLNELCEDGRTEHQLYSIKFNKAIIKYIKKYFIDDVLLDKGYGLDDVWGFLQWLLDNEHLGLPKP
jgi:hypothetical protein